MPAEIRKIESYNPTLQLGIGVNATKWLNDKREFGIRVGLNVEGRGMKTQAKVKNYYTQIEDDTGAQTKGFLQDMSLPKWTMLMSLCPFYWYGTRLQNGIYMEDFTFLS